MKKIRIYYKILSFIFVASGLTISASGQIQKGLAIEGEAAYDYSGWCVDMPDALTIAIGAYRNDGSGPNSGHTRIYVWDGGAWVQKGNDIDGAINNDYSGYSISMPDANNIAIGSPRNDANGYDAGHVRIFQWNGNAWVQKGVDIDGETAHDFSGWSVSMPDSNTVAIGAPHNAGNGTWSGHVRIYIWNNGAWIQKGLDIDAEAAGNKSGWSISMPNSNTIAIGAPRNFGSGNWSGHVRVYSWEGNAWIQKGADIDGEAAGDFSGWSVSMPDGNTVAIGALENDGNGTSAGHVRIFEWDDITWVQKGMDIDGDTAWDLFGYSVSMPDANTVAIGAPNNDCKWDDAGHVRFYKWNGSTWAQVGMDIYGEVIGDSTGFFVCMPNAITVAVGAPNNDGNGTSAGHVRVFSLFENSIKQEELGIALVIHPNPTYGELILDLSRVYLDIQVIIMNQLGQEISRQSFNKSDRLHLNLEGEAGLYVLKLHADDKVTMLKVVKQ